MRKLFTQRIFMFVLSCFCILNAGSAIAAPGDAGVQMFLTPTSPVCKGSNSVSVKIQNFGSTTITDVEVHWKVNGNSQNTYNFSNTLAAGAQATVTLGNFNFTSGSYTVVAYTKDPNNSADLDNTNDTATTIITISSKLTGTYTIGGTSPSYNTFHAAITALKTHGICGPVTFNMRTQVDTTVHEVIPEIAGADDNNTITFKSQNGDSNSVVLSYPSEDTLADNYMIQMDGADYFTFQEITMQRTGTRANARVIDFTNGSTNNTIKNCHLKGITGITTNSLCAIIYSSGGNAFNDSLNTFKNNLIEDGSLGVYFNGVSSLSVEYNTIVQDNVFVDQYSKGVQMSNQGDVLISGNTFNTVSTYKGYAGVYLDRSLRPHNIVKNQVLGTPGTGMYFVDCTAQAGVHGTIANNFIWSNDSAGISMVNGDYQDVVFNSILMTGNNATFAALLMRGSGQGKIVRNNILANFGLGYSYVISDSAVFGVQSSNYNDLYAVGANIGEYNGTNLATLANWKVTAHRDTNSVATNPNFVSNTNLHSTSVAMSDLGKKFGTITKDIDGQTRSVLTPDIGADEYSAALRDVGVTEIVVPQDSGCGDAAMIVKVIVTNTGQQGESGFNVVTKITGAITATLTKAHAATIAPGASDTTIYTLNPLNTAAGGTYHFQSYTSLSVDDVHPNDTLDMDITLFAPPAVPTSANDSICGPGIGSLSASSPDTIHWYDQASGGSILYTGSNFVTPFLNTTTTFYVAAKAGCEGTRNPVAVVVLPAPNVQLGNDTSVLQGASVTLDAGSGAVYLWSTGQTTQTISVNTSGCYWVRATNGSGCIVYDTLCVNVVAPNDMGITTISSPRNHDCASDSVKVMVHVSNLGQNSATMIPVEVQVSGAATATFNDTVYTTVAAGTDTVILLGYVNVSSGGALLIKAFTSYINDLNHTNDTIVNRDTLLMQPNPPTGLSGTRCGQGPITLNAASSDSVLWYDAPLGGTLVHTGDSYFIPGLNVTTTFYAQSGSYCNNQQRKPITAIIHPLPNVNLGPDASGIDSLVLHAGPGYVSYLWSNASTGQDLTVTSSATYFVCVTDTNGCSNCDSINVNIIVGIEQINPDAQVSLYPNPARNSVTIEMKKSINGNASILISDLQGQLLLNDKIKNAAQKTIDVSTFAKGIYYLQVRTDNGTSVFRLIIE